MCLSNVYIEEMKEEKLLLENVAYVGSDGGNIQVRALFGESKNLEGCYISEVNLVENYVILVKSGGHAGNG